MISTNYTRLQTNKKTTNENQSRRSDKPSYEKAFNFRNTTAGTDGSKGIRVPSLEDLINGIAFDAKNGTNKTSINKDYINKMFHNPERPNKYQKEDNNLPKRMPYEKMPPEQAKVKTDNKEEKEAAPGRKPGLNKECTTNQFGQLSCQARDIPRRMPPEKIPPETENKKDGNSKYDRNPNIDREGMRNQFGKLSRYNNNNSNNNNIISRYNKPFNFSRADKDTKADSDNKQRGNRLSGKSYSKTEGGNRRSRHNNWSNRSFRFNNEQLSDKHGRQDGENNVNGEKRSRRGNWSNKSFRFNSDQLSWQNGRQDGEDKANGRKSSRRNSRSNRSYNWSNSKSSRRPGRQDGENRTNKYRDFRHDDRSIRLGKSRQNQGPQSADTKFLLQTLKAADKDQNGIISREEASALSWINTFAPVPPDSPTAKSNEAVTFTKNNFKSLTKATEGQEGIKTENIGNVAKKDGMPEDVSLKDIGQAFGNVKKMNDSMIDYFTGTKLGTRIKEQPKKTL